MEFAEGQMKGLGAQPGSTKEVCHSGVIRKVKGAGEWGDSGTGCPRAPFMKDLVRLSVQQLSAVSGVSSTAESCFATTLKGTVSGLAAEPLYLLYLLAFLV